jgi:hypothetical protein
VKRVATGLLVTAAVIAVGSGTRAAVGSRPDAAPASGSPAATATATATGKARPRVEQTAPLLPKPEDFTMAVRRVRTTCGFAIRPPAELADQRTIHCKATYRTTVSYHGKPLNPRGTYVVFYEVMGSVLGGELYSFTIKGGHVPVLAVRSALVHSGSVLSAVATDLEWLP